MDFNPGTTAIDQVICQNVLAQQIEERIDSRQYETALGNPVNSDPARFVRGFTAYNEHATSPIYIVITVNNDETEGQVINESIPEKLKYIKKSYGLNTSQLARVMDISRPSIYKWLDGMVAPQSDSSNKKIELLYEFLSEIPTEDARYFGKFSKKFINSENTVMDALSDTELSTDDLRLVYSNILNDIKLLRRKTG